MEIFNQKLIIGETCLLDNQLRRMNIIDNENYFFNHLLINIDCITQIIDDDFRFNIDNIFLEKKYQTFYNKENIGYTKWFNTKYISNENIFSWPFFCFFHIENFDDTTLHSLYRKMERTHNVFTNDQPVTLYYYYRFNDEYNVQAVKSKLNKFVEKCIKKYKKKFTCVYLTNNPGHSKNYSINFDELIYHIHIQSPNSWIGTDDNWDGHKDNDIFHEIRGYIC